VQLAWCAEAGGSFLDHPTLLAIPGDDGKSADVCCAECGRQLVRLSQQAASGLPRDLGMVMALQLFFRHGVFHLAAGYEDGTLLVWDLHSPAAPLAAARLQEEPLLTLDLDEGGEAGVCGGAEGALLAFEVDYAVGSVRVVRRLELPKPGVNAVAIRPDGKLLASAGWDGRARVFKRGSGRPLAVLKVRPLEGQGGDGGAGER
jgi:WD40 repeat protein